jgi:hypothetical protein
MDIGQKLKMEMIGLLAKFKPLPELQSASGEELMHRIPG